MDRLEMLKQVKKELLIYKKFLLNLVNNHEQSEEKTNDIKKIKRKVK